MATNDSKRRGWAERIRDFLSDRGGTPVDERPSKLYRFVHFWVLVGRSFARNRCPVRASALAYTTLLALIPMLAVVVSVTSSLLKTEGEDRIDQFIAQLVASVTPPAAVTTNGVVIKLPARSGPAAAGELTNQTNAAVATAETGASDRGTNQAALALLAQNDKAVAARKSVAREIHEFIQNTRSGALGVTGTVLLIVAAISMLGRIEDTFNDIWGVAQGRSWFMRIVLYWGVITLAPVLLVVALGLATGPHLEATRKWLTAMPFVGQYLLSVGFQLLPILVLCLTFGLFYMLIPNVKVLWSAALVGGLVSGVLFHLNNMVSVLYVSRVVSNSKIYGSLGLLPVFMIGLYFSWLILLFGAQVAYAYQNLAAYLEEKQVENINQRGREFIALRLMTCVGQRFARGEPPPSTIELSTRLSVPTRLIRRLMQTLSAARLVVETAGQEPAFLPARPLETMTCHDILLALRAGQGQELATRDEPGRAEVYGEYQRIQEAERVTASSVTLLALVNRSQSQGQVELPASVAGLVAERSLPSDSSRH